MKPIRWVSILLLLSLWLGSVSAGAQAGGGVQAPVLKWSRGGCYSSWCETGWYSSPAVADLDGDGAMEVIAGAYSIVALDGDSGELLWRVKAGHDRTEPDASNVGRTWPDMVVADLNGDDRLEIASAHSNGWVSVYDQDGYFQPDWPRQITPGSELRSLAVYDLDDDGSLEVLAAATRSDDQWFALEHDGQLRASEWPQHGPDSTVNGYTSGCYNQNLAAGDLDGDGRAEIVGPNDTHYLAAFQDDGSQMLASTIYGVNPNGTPKVWSLVGVHVSHDVDLRGYATCGVDHRPNFAHSAPVIADVNADGVQETIVVGNVYNCGTSPYTDLYQMPYILNADRTRWQGSGYDWGVLPAPDGAAAPLSEDYNRIENTHPNPVPVDLDGDGLLEIVFPSYDGRMHAYWLDKSEHGSWPYAVTQPGEGFLRFASEPAVADLNGDGTAEVIFATWTEKGSNASGDLLILDAQGNLLQRTPLPAGEGADWNGGLAAPTLADIDGDPDQEVVLNTAHSGVLAYDLPGTAGARLLWATGRGSTQRSGSYLYGDLARSQMRVDRLLAATGETLRYEFELQSDLLAVHQARLVDPLPEGLLYAGGLSASAGSVSEAGGTITWQGDVPVGQPVTIAFQAQVDPGLSGAQTLVNVATLSDELGRTWELRAITIANGRGVYLPLLGR